MTSVTPPPIALPPPPPVLSGGVLMPQPSALPVVESTTDALLTVPAEIADAFFKSYSGATLRIYRCSLEAFARWVGVPVDRLPHLFVAWGALGSHASVERYRAYLRDERGLAPATINGHLAAIRSLLRFLRRVHLCTWALDVRLERVVPYRDTTGPGVAAVRAVLQAAASQADAKKAARDVAIVRMLADLAIRRAELVGLDIEHVQRGDSGVPVAVQVMGKGHRQRQPMTLPPKTAAALATWLAMRGERPGALFTPVDPGVGRPGRGGRVREPEEGRLTGESVGRLLAALARRAGVTSDVRPHGVRHTAITALLDSGAGIREAQRYSRHADPRTVMVYDDNRQDIAGQMARRVSELI